MTPSEIAANLASCSNEAQTALRNLPVNDDEGWPFLVTEQPLPAGKTLILVIPKRRAARLGSNTRAQGRLMELLGDVPKAWWAFGRVFLWAKGRNEVELAFVVEGDKGAFKAQVTKSTFVNTLWGGDVDLKKAVSTKSQVKVYDGIQAFEDARAAARSTPAPQSSALLEQVRSSSSQDAEREALVAALDELVEARRSISEWIASITEAVRAAPLPEDVDPQAVARMVRDFLEMTFDPLIQAIPSRDPEAITHGLATVKTRLRSSEEGRWVVDVLRSNGVDLKATLDQRVNRLVEAARSFVASRSES